MNSTRTAIRWWVMGLIAVVTVINYIDRTSLAVMWPEISRDTGLTKEHYATLVSAFMIAYALGQAVSGRIFDAVGTRLGFVLAVVFWSLACAGHGIMRGLGGLASARALLGFSEAGNWPGATKAAAEWFPKEERALAQGIFNAGASLGAVISVPLIALLFGLYGWRATFVIVGGLGLLWLVPWCAVMRGRTARTFADAVQTASEQAASKVAVPRVSWRAVLRERAAWGIIVARFFLDPVWWLFINWLPLYLAERFGFDVRQIGLFAWVPYLGAIIGSLSGGWLSGHWIAAGMEVTQARKRAIFFGGALMLPGFLAVTFASGPVAAVLAIGCVLCGFQVMINNIQTLASDLFAGAKVGTVAGLGGMSAVCGVLVFSTWLVPVLSGVSYTPVFLLGALLVPCGYAAVYFLLPSASSHKG